MLKAIVTDIEGTTSSIHFVKKVLFPYSAQAIRAFIEQHKDEAEVRVLLEQVVSEAGLERSAHNNISVIVQYLLDWIKEDKKIAALKAIQGLVWEAGYQKGDYQAHLYADAYHTLKRWHQQGMPIYVFSSGSVYAQKLFFSFSEYGDISEFFSGYFDTNTGPKKSSLSYSLIAQTIGEPPERILFLSDIVEEIDAAAQAGMKVCWFVRPDDTTASEADIKRYPYNKAVSFEQVVVD